MIRIMSANTEPLVFDYPGAVLAASRPRSPAEEYDDAPTTAVRGVAVTAHDVHAAIMRAARYQLMTCAEARAIVDAGFGAQLASLVEAISGNAANPIVDMFERVD